MRAVHAGRSFVAHPLAVLAASFAGGILAARFCGVGLVIYLLGGALCSSLAVLFLVRRCLTVATVVVSLAFLCAGGALAMLEQRGAGGNRVGRFYDEGVIAAGDPVEVEGVMMAAPEPAPESFYLTLRVERLRFKEREYEAGGVVWLFVPVRNGVVRGEYERLELRYGARLRVMTALDRTESFRNPGGSSLTEYLERRGYDAKGVVKSPLLVERLGDERVFVPLAWLYEWRQRLLALIEKKFNAETAGVLDAALLGNRYHLSREAAERFREGGTFHVLVISGLHISFIGGLILLIVRLLTRRRVWQFGCSVTFLWAYALMVGAEASVVRAALMFTVVALAPVLHRRAGSLNALGGAGLLLLVQRPGNLFDPSFQLTFLSVLMIVTMAWPLLERLREVGVWRPTRERPYPPACASAFRAAGEILFWREREFKREIARSIYSYHLFKHPLAARLERLRLQGLLRYAASAMIISASVQVGLLPLLILYFHRLSLASFLLNIVVGVLMAALSLLALAALFLSQLSVTLAAPLIWLAERLNWLMVHSVDPFAGAHLASIRLPEYTGWMACLYLLYYAPTVMLAFALARWQPLRRFINTTTAGEQQQRARRLFNSLAGVAFVTLLVLIIAHPLSAGRPDGRLRVDFLDVGQGDAALVTMPDGTTLLIDAGGRPNFDRRQRNDESDEQAESGETVEDEASEPFKRDARSIGEAVVSEYLWWRGLESVDYILATHADADHIDGLNDIARNFKVRAAFVARAPARDSEYIKFAESMGRYGVPMRLVGRGHLLRFGDVNAEVLWPVPTLDQESPSRNNDSIVLRLSYGQRVFLLTGDLEKEGEASILNARDELACDVLKVGHHGSKTSSTAAFITATHPSLAIISVGLSSPFGHPNPQIVERLSASGAQVITTGQRGTITISTDGQDLKVETFEER
ncbi:MAG TPA: ComEC/Rec2 family competence protein [Pyrinomonadaceae bacterium]|jgi:competence protein ComEC|nr:ComEC/Rec2 family competence protein [Pyrinomonadaceae bacterium]